MFAFCMSNFEFRLRTFFSNLLTGPGQQFRYRIDGRDALGRRRPVRRPLPDGREPGIACACDVDVRMIADITTDLGADADPPRRPGEDLGLGLAHTLHFRNENDVEQSTNAERVDRAVLHGRRAVRDEAERVAAPAQLRERVDDAWECARVRTIPEPEVVD